MTPSQIAELILLIGWPAVRRIKDLIDSGDEPVTQEQWTELLLRVNRTHEEALGPRPEPEEEDLGH